MANILKILDQLEEALPEMREALGGEAEGEGEEGLPPLPEDMGPPEDEGGELPPLPEDEEEPMDLETPPKMKKKPLPF